MSTPPRSLLVPPVPGPSETGFPEGLYALCDDSVRSELSLMEKARLLLAGGVKVLQLRMKRTPVREAVAAARTISLLCAEAKAVCIVNDRVDLALVSGAHGVHLGDEDLPCAEARSVLGPDRVIGVTVRTLEGARTAAADGATYVGLGPIFATKTKSVAHALLGLEGLKAIAREAPLPVVAIAGIGRSNIAEVAEAGAHCAAVASDLLNAPDLSEQARELARFFETGRSRRTIERSS